MKKRYRLKIIPGGGTAANVLRLFPNMLTFVGYPSDKQLEFVAAAAGVLAPFGVQIDIKEG